MSGIRKLKIEEYGKCKDIVEVKNRLGDKFDGHQEGNRRIYVYEIDGKQIGEGALVYENGDSDYTIPNKRIYLSRVIVDVSYRNQGIGAEIVDYLVDVARDEGFKEISIGVDKNNEAAVHLYRKKGFTTIIFEGEDEAGEYYKLLRKLD